MRIASNNIQKLNHGEIFVFGSNLAGQHAGGAAKLAADKFGAEWGVGKGPTGQCYAIPTIGADGKVLTPNEIDKYVHEFIYFAETNPELKFLVTEIGCGIAGHSVEEIAPLFAWAWDMPNVYLPNRFVEYMMGFAD